MRSQYEPWLFMRLARTRFIHQCFCWKPPEYQLNSSLAINRQFSMIRTYLCSIASPTRANARTDKHLVLDAHSAVFSGSENCRKIAAKSDILFLSVATAPIARSWGMFMGFYRLVSPISPSTETLWVSEYANERAPGWNDNDFVPFGRSIQSLASCWILRA